MCKGLSKNWLGWVWLWVLLPAGLLAQTKPGLPAGVDTTTLGWYRRELALRDSVVKKLETRVREHAAATLRDSLLRYHAPGRPWVPSAPPAPGPSHRSSYAPPNWRQLKPRQE
ncbi:MAG: hypothetical protein MUC97_05870 [Bernardetiaceae bacterium]|jgi:hypothetical protein|nr:hypothetical protein [Bernardetiaceae bacterium]